ncbi:RDD family protein [Thermomonospora umbrina]|uniref:Putative RDD family membrane protein YckC n=1 Tax=Thermomonospora umbrina TaxID=111806 RepID=A0A3D9SSZ7_9ACTN|nr:RDD family protein [Thermomonospora umbrina]REE96095.1 putative RDD family membrane protein YckC [Thermomonospora umbrina]
MTQPPPNPPPGEEPWQPPHGQPPQGQPPQGQPPGQQPPPWPGPSQPYPGQEPPPYQGGYGGQPPQGGGLPSYGGPGGPGGEYQDPAAGLASRWARLGAAILDGILLTVVIGLLTFPFVDYGEMFETSEGDEFVVPTGQWTANLLGAALGFLYFWLLTYKWGQTLGKKALGIQVVRAADGGAVSQGQAAGRAAFYTVLGGICGCIGFIDVLWILWDPRRQALHDKVAQTVVRKVVPGAPDPYTGR